MKIDIEKKMQMVRADANEKHNIPSKIKKIMSAKDFQQFESWARKMLMFEHVTEHDWLVYMNCFMSGMTHGITQGRTV